MTTALAETNPHVERDAQGVLRIRGTGYKLVLLVGEHLAHGWEAPELRREHPELSLAQIHAALAYHHDHAEELRNELRARSRTAAELRAALTGGANAAGR
jgi:uncharacterized protein (DUF433 family)